MNTEQKLAESIAALEAATAALHHARQAVLGAAPAAKTDYLRDDRARLLSPDDTADFMRDRLRGLAQEELYAIFLNCRNEVNGVSMITRGLVDRTAIHSREVYREAIRVNASRLILVHNHPSGDPSPSQGDIRSTQDLSEAGKIIGIHLVDHIVMGDRTASRNRDFSSLRELGYISHSA